jgi:hypothetical protein
MIKPTIRATVCVEVAESHLAAVHPRPAPEQGGDGHHDHHPAHGEVMELHGVASGSTAWAAGSTVSPPTAAVPIRPQQDASTKKSCSPCLLDIRTAAERAAAKVGKRTTGGPPWGDQTT